MATFPDPSDNARPVLPYARRRSLARRAAPVFCLIVGVYLLVGCIPIPSTQQYMMNGKLKPSYAIGKGKDDAIRLGYTKIDDAVRVLCERIAGRQYFSIASGYPERSAKEIRQGLVVLPGDRRYVLPYNRRSGYLVWPLCFDAWTMSEMDYIALDVDAAGIVVDYHTSHDPKKLGLSEEQISQSLQAFYQLSTTRPTTTAPSTRP